MLNIDEKTLDKFVRQNMGFEVAHDYHHAVRVKNWALKIAEAENYPELELVETAALLHDIGLTKGRKNHGASGAQMAREFLEESSKFTLDQISEICFAIKHHDTNRPPSRSTLLNIIQDADMLELFGPIGIVRAAQSRAGDPTCDPKQPLGETYGFSAKDFDERFDKGLGKGAYFVDQLNFHISCFDNLSTKSGREFAKPLLDEMRIFLNSLH